MKFYPRKWLVYGGFSVTGKSQEELTDFNIKRLSVK